MRFQMFTAHHSQLHVRADVRADVDGEKKRNMFSSYISMIHLEENKFKLRHSSVRGQGFNNVEIFKGRKSVFSKCLFISGTAHGTHLFLFPYHLN